VSADDAIECHYYTCTVVELIPRHGLAMDNHLQVNHFQHEHWTWCTCKYGIIKCIHLLLDCNRFSSRIYSTKIIITEYNLVFWFQNITKMLTQVCNSCSLKGTQVYQELSELNNRSTELITLRGWCRKRSKIKSSGGVVTNGEKWEFVKDYN